MKTSELIELLIEREEIALWPDEERPGMFFASANSGRGRDYEGPSYLIAAMRCLVAGRFGDGGEE